MKNKEKIINKVYAFTCTLVHIFLLLSISTVAYSGDVGENSSESELVNTFSSNATEILSNSVEITTPEINYTVPAER